MGFMENTQQRKLPLTLMIQLSVNIIHIHYGIIFVFEKRILCKFHFDLEIKLHSFFGK